MTDARAHWPIFIISLPGDEARRAGLVSRLESFGLQPEIVLGVDGRKGLPPAFETQVDRARSVRYGRSMTDGELACALSHQRVYRLLLERGAPGAVVFEDDAILSPEFGAFMQARGYERANLDLFGHRKSWVARFSRRRICDGVAAYRLVASPLLAHGYSISAGAARQMLDTTSPVRAPADWPCDISRLGALVLIPQIAVQPPVDPAHSHLETERSGQPRKTGRHRRFRKRSYWLGWIRKRLGKRVA